ncbi:hypothetical protein Tco_0613536 [Tanacetum coccineum]
MVALLEKTDGSEGFHQIVDFLNASHIRFALSKNPTIYDSHIKQFWQTATVNTLNNREQEITATVDGHVKTVTIASEVEIPQSNFPTQTPVADEVAFTGVDVVYGGAATTVSSINVGQGSGNIPKSPTLPHDSPLPEGHTPGSVEGSMTLHELTVLCTKLSQKVESLETELKQTKQTCGVAFTKLIKRVKKLEQTIKTSQARKRTKLVVSENEEELVAEDSSKQGRSLIEEMDLDVGISLVPPQVSTAGPEVSTADVEFTTASAFVSTASPKRDADTTTDDLTLAETLMEIRKSAAKAKGKVVMQESEQPKKLVELVNQRKKFFAQERAEAKRNKPMTLAQQKTYMSNYIKNQEGGYTLQQLKSLSFEQVKEIFETTMKRVQSFVPMDSELEIGEASGSGEEQSAEKEKELSEEELQKLLVVVLVEEVYVEALQVKYPIIDWEVYTEESRKYWKIIRAGNHTEAYQIFADMLKKFDKHDLVKLWEMVQEKFNTTEPTYDKEKELWVELKRLFEPDDDDTLWKLQRYMRDPLKWWLYDTCGVHHVSTERGHDIFMLVE